MKRLLVLLIFLLALALPSKGQTINAASCSVTDVQTALNSVTQDGTTVLVPAGTCSYASTVSFTVNFSVTIQGKSVVTGSCTNGGTCVATDNTVISVAGASPAWSLGMVANHSLRVTGISFIWASGAQQFNGMLNINGTNDLNHQFRLDHCHFSHANIVDLIIHGSKGPLYGVADHNMFNTGSSNEDAFRVEHPNWSGNEPATTPGYADGLGNSSWADDAHWGTNQFVFFENNFFTFDGSLSSGGHAFAYDCTALGGRMVFRYNVLTQGMAIQVHGTGSGDANFRTCRAMEIYGNVMTFSSNPGTFNFSQLLELEGGGLYYWNNTSSGYLKAIQNDYIRSTNATYSQVNTPNGWGYCLSSPLGGVSGPSPWDNNLSYPCMDQTGRGKGDLITGCFLGPGGSCPNSTKVDSVSNTIRFPNQAFDAAYGWGNSTAQVPSNPTHYFVSTSGSQVTLNRDIFLELPNIDNSATFDGTAGVGCGPAAGVGCTNPVVQPSTCSPNVGYWNPASGPAGTLFTCGNSNNWTATYSPYTYPHPLTVQATGWTFVQDSPLIFCSPGPRSTCTPGLGNIIPTVAGSVWIVYTQTGTCNPTCGPDHDTISSVTGGGGTWVHCPNCAVSNSSGLSADAFYNLSGNAGTTNVTITMASTSGNVFGAGFVEFLPPPGYTGVFDVAGTATPSGCTTCTAASPGTPAATDVIWENPGGGPNATWNSWSSPYVTDGNGSGFCLNCTSGTAPTQTFGNSNQHPEFMALAFSSTAGNINIAPATYNVANFTAFVPNSACSTCTVPIPSTTAGNLLYIESANEVGSFISSVVGGGTWVIPTQCQVKLVVQGQNNANSCAYVLSATGGVTSLSVHMQGNSAAHGFAVTEVSTTLVGGLFSLDAIGNTLNQPNASCGGFCFPGQPLTLTADDFMVQTAWIVGQNPTGPNFFARPTIPTTSQGAQGPGAFNAFFAQNASIAFFPDIGPPFTTPTWVNAVQNQNTFVSGAAFKASASAVPNAPTGLTVVTQ